MYQCTANTYEELSLWIPWCVFGSLIKRELAAAKQHRWPCRILGRFTASDVGFATESNGRAAAVGLSAGHGLLHRPR